jgi:hypothetical protein
MIGVKATRQAASPHFRAKPLHRVGGAVLPPQILVGGRFAEILYFGAAPGYPFSMNQYDPVSPTFHPRGIAERAEIGHAATSKEPKGGNFSEAQK